MAGRDINQWVGNGRIGRDLELKYTQSGKAVCSVSIASSFDDNTNWFNVVFWDKLAEIVCQYCRKGSFISIAGRLQTRSYDKNGEKHYITEIVANSMQMLDKKSDSGDRQENRGQQQSQQQSHGQAGPDDDIPF